MESPFSRCELRPLMRLLSHTPYQINRLRQPITTQTQPGPRQTAASPHRTGNCSLWLIGGNDKQRQRGWRVRVEWGELEGGRFNVHLYFPWKGKSAFPLSNYLLDGISNEEGKRSQTAWVKNICSSDCDYCQRLFRPLQTTDNVRRSSARYCLFPCMLSIFGR